jgi:hypothetical protein
MIPSLHLRVILLALALCGAVDTRTLELHGCTATLERLQALPGFRLSVKIGGVQARNSRHIPYQVYRFELADVNNDGSTDVMLGVVKRTHFDPVPRKRLFVYRVSSEGIVPLWLGSRVCRSLVDFRPIRVDGKTHVMTVERTARGGYSNGIYRWQGFGLELIRYINKETDYETASNELRTR